MDPALEEKIRDAMLRTFFAETPRTHLDSPVGQKDLLDHVRVRYEQCRDNIVPWVSRQGDLKGAEVVEIGCGTGSSTAAFAEKAGHVYGYDISARSVRAAHERLRVMGTANASVFDVPHRRIIETLRSNHRDSVDLVLLYAVMEHQTVTERLETLECCWELLRPGGRLVVSDTPNRLAYKHYHTSFVPFFDMLPPSLAWKQLQHSPRKAFRESMAAALRQSDEHALEVLARWGTGVSHHEFEAVLGNLERIVVGDGFDPEILSWKPIVLEEELLISYFVMSELPVPLAFARVSLDVILRKPGGDEEDAFVSSSAARAERLRNRYMALPGVLNDYFESRHASWLTLEQATALADSSLNGRTLLRLLARKLRRKVTGGRS